MKTREIRKRPGNKQTIAAWITPELQTAIDLWRRRHPGTSQTQFALTAFAEKLRKDGIHIEDENVFADGRVRKLAPAPEPNSDNRHVADKILKDAVSQVPIAPPKTKVSKRRHGADQA